MPLTRLDRRRILRWALVLAVIGLAAQGGRLIHSRISAHEVREGGPIPYTVMLREIVHGPDGTTTEGFDVTWAIGSDGSSVRRVVHKERKEQGKKLSDASSERTVQFASGIEVAVNEFADTKTSTLAKNVNPARWQRDPTSKCISSFAGQPMSSTPEAVIGEETVAGYRTVKIVAKNITSWYALDYGCAMVKNRWDFGGQEYSEKYLLALIPGEPSPELFHVSENAREVSPSERILGSKNDCSSCNEHTVKVLRKLDQDYDKRRALK